LTSTIIMKRRSSITRCRYPFPSACSVQSPLRQTPSTRRVETPGWPTARKSVSNRLGNDHPSISIDGADGDGNRVKTPSGPPLRGHGQVQNGQTTIYIGAVYEKNTSTGEVTTYYFAGSQRIATPALHRRRFCAVQVCARMAAR
jgi:hypothetical protein